MLPALITKVGILPTEQIISTGINYSIEEMLSTRFQITLQADIQMLNQKIAVNGVVDGMEKNLQFLV